MTTHGPDYFDFAKLLSKPLLLAPIWRDLAEACNKVLGREVEERRRRLARSRDSLKNRRGDILSQIQYLPEDNNPAIDIDTNLPSNLIKGQIIPKAKITRVVTNSNDYGQPDLIDYFEVEFNNNEGKRSRWLLPVNATQERTLLIKNSYMSGFDFFNSKLSDKDYQRLYEYLNMFWWDNGLDDNFIKFIGFIKNLKLELVPLWSLDDGTDYITVLEELNEEVLPASQGGSWYLTSHVEVRFDLAVQNTLLYGIDLDEIERLFYLFAPIMLVLDRITGVIDVLSIIGIIGEVEAEIINYGTMGYDIDVLSKINMQGIVDNQIINYGQFQVTDIDSTYTFLLNPMDLCVNYSLWQATHTLEDYLTTNLYNRLHQIVQVQLYSATHP